ncbi:MAG: chloride channel protein [Planctomycetaceae bacterium]|nr:chloride channel protein [Planctomycetaceae bacterium]
MPLFRKIENFINGFDFRSTGKWFVLSSLVGVVAGVGAVLFQVLGQFVVFIALFTVSGFAPAEADGELSLFHVTSSEISLGLVTLVMGLGGLASGWLVWRFAPEAGGHGTDAAIDSFHNKRGVIRSRVPIVKTIASAITLGTGGSAGREGPIAQIGAGFGSYLASRLNLSDRDRRIMLTAGMGAGVGAIFRAPLAGALFAGEILYKDADLESDVIVPTAISSIVSYSVYGLLLTLIMPSGSDAEIFTPLFGDNLHYRLMSFAELIPMTVMALALVLVGILYINVFYGTHRLMERLPVAPYFRPAIGAVLASATGIGLYFAVGKDPVALGILSTGYGALQTAVENPDQIGIKVLLIIAVGKIVATSCTISSGGSGGVFGPSMVIGGCVGAAIGLWFNHLFGFETDPGAYAIIGMAGFFAGIAHAPISTIIMVSEMTGDYQLLLPTMWVSTLCFLFCRRWTLYEKQVKTRLESPAHRGDFIVDVLEGIKVADVYRKDPQLTYIRESMSLDEIVHTLAKTHQQYFPVIDSDRRVVGIFSADDVRSYLYDETIWHLAVARDVMITNIVSVLPTDDLNTALRRFTSINVDELPVFDPEDSGKLLGMLRRKETIAFYNSRLIQHKLAMSDED